MTCKHLRRQRRLAWIAACAVTLSVFGVGYTKKAKPGTTFSLMTWNIIHGNGGYTTKVGRQHKLRDHDSGKNDL